MRIFLLVALLLIIPACGPKNTPDKSIGGEAQEVIDLVETFYVGRTKDYSEIIIEKPDKHLIVGKGNQSNERPQREVSLEEEASKVEGLVKADEDEKRPIQEEEEVKKEKTNSDKGEDKKQEIEKEADTKGETKGESFHFEPYYSAPIGSQGLFDDLDEATEEGWRISEMEDPSSFLGYTPSGWEVYPVWYYSSPDVSVKFYTLNFYQ